MVISKEDDVMIKLMWCGLLGVSGGILGFVVCECDLFLDLEVCIMVSVDECLVYFGIVNFIYGVVFGDFLLDSVIIWICVMFDVVYFGELVLISFGVFEDEF